MAQVGSSTIPSVNYDFVVQFPYALMFHSSEIEAILTFFNITDPLHPTLFYEHHISGDFQITGAEVEGDLLYVIGEDWDGLTGTLLIFDFSDAAHPLKITAYTIDIPTDITIKGQKAYIATRGGGLKILDVSIPADPKIIGQYDLHYTVDPHNWELKVDVSDDVAYLGTFKGIVIADVYDIEHITKLDYFVDENIWMLQYHNGYVYYSSGFDGLEILKVSLDLSDRNRIPGYSIFLLFLLSIVSMIYIVRKPEMKTHS